MPLWAPSAAFLAMSGASARSSELPGRVYDEVAGPLRELALGLEDENRFCVRMIELVQIACGNSRSAAEAFIKSLEHG